MKKSEFLVLLLTLSSPAHASEDFTLTLNNNTSDQYFCYNFSGATDYNWGNRGTELDGAGCVSPYDKKSISGMSDTINLFDTSNYLKIPIYVPMKSYYGQDYTNESNFVQFSLYMINKSTTEYVELKMETKKGGDLYKLMEIDDVDPHNITCTLNSENITITVEGITGSIEWERQ